MGEETAATAAATTEQAQPATAGAREAPAKAGADVGELILGGTGEPEDNAKTGGAGKETGKSEGTAQSDEAKSEGGTGDGDANTPGDPDTVPEDGKYQITLPEGAVELDAEMLERFSPMATEIGVTQGQAQKLAEFLAGQRVIEYERGLADYVKTVKEWAEAVKTDEEIGGAKLPETQRFGNEAIKQFGDEEFLALLRDNGLGNHPAVVRFVSRVGRALADDKFEAGTRVETETRAEDRWYGSAAKS